MLPPDSVKHVIVYGTLRAGFRAHHYLESRTKFIQECRVSGRMYDLGQFPAIKLEDSPVHTFVGEVYEILDQDVVDILDSYEGFRGEGKDNFYNRVVVNIPLHEEVVPCYVYEFARDNLGPPIRSGDWREYSARKH